MKISQMFAMIAIFFGVASGGVLVVYLWSENKPHYVAENYAVPRGVDARGETQKSRATEPGPAEQDLAANNADGETRSFAEVAIVDSWMKNSGFSPRSVQAYLQQYTEEQLTALSEQGDRLATDTLLRICRDQWCADDKKIMLAERGIVQGSIRAISIMAIVSTSGLYFGEHLSDQQAKDTLTETLAYQRLLDLRGVGEAKANHISIEFDMEMFAERYPHLVPLSASDEQKIWDRARELYDYYQAERHKLGLGDFDNELPNEVKRFFGLL